MTEPQPALGALRTVPVERRHDAPRLPPRPPASEHPQPRADDTPLILEPPDDWVREPTEDDPGAARATRDHYRDQPESKEPDSWNSVDLQALRETGLQDQPAPAILARVDGVSIIYAGKIHSFVGESESGKSWGALVACLQEIRLGHPVAYLDFEDDAPTVVGRMLALGATWEQLIAHFDYRRPEEPFSLEALFDIVGRRPTLAVIDGVTEAMTAHDLDPDKNRDSAKFIAMLPRPLARAGAAVIQVDHVTKNPETRGRYAIGAQHKRAAVTGAQYTFTVSKPIGRGLAGVVTISVEKDKPGHVRRASAGKKAAELHLSSNPDGSIVTAELRPAAGGDAGAFRPTVLMERASRQLEAVGAAGLTKNGLKTAAGGHAEHVALAAEVLIAEGYVRVIRQGQAQMHVSVKPYRRADDPLDSDYQPEEER